MGHFCGGHVDHQPQKKTFCLYFSRFHGRERGCILTSLGYSELLCFSIICSNQGDDEQNSALESWMTLVGPKWPQQEWVSNHLNLFVAEQSESLLLWNLLKQSYVLILNPYPWRLFNISSEKGILENNAGNVTMCTELLCSVLQK